MSKLWIAVIAIIIVVIAFVAWEWRYSPLFSQLTGSSGQGQLVGEAEFQCDSGLTITASFYQGAQAPASANGQPPTPTGSASLSLSDGRTMTLAQSISADGGRYASQDGNTVFWTKGNGTLWQDNGAAQVTCVKVAASSGGLSQVYENSTQGISVRYPSGYTADAAYAYQELGPGKDIKGVKFTIDPSIATGTNLGSDSYVSVEEIPNTPQCTADLFLDLANGGEPTALTQGDMTYSYASTTGAGAGNRYEEQVFALPGTNPCVAVRYFIHYGVIENYPAGSVQQFNESSLTAQFDAVRQSLVVNQ